MSNLESEIWLLREILNCVWKCYVLEDHIGSFIIKQINNLSLYDLLGSKFKSKHLSKTKSPK
jgi:hypothetical protein